MQPSIRSYTKIVHRVTFGSDTPHVQNRISKSPVNDLAAFIANCHRLLVITGAGVSTDSGVPDYRWPRMPRCCPHLALLHCRGRNGTYVRNPDHRPITYQEFMKNGEQQKRYWVRGLVGFEQFSRAQPNITHRCLRSLEVLFAAKSASCDIVTQNVDRLHFKAGSVGAVELHGNAFTVKCTSCAHTVDRKDLHREIVNQNSAWLKQV
jgi:NAD-dependent deacetylase sirtuin 4